MWHHALKQELPVILHNLLASNIFHTSLIPFLHNPGCWLIEPHNSPYSVSHNLHAQHSHTMDLYLIICTFLSVT